MKHPPISQLAVQVEVASKPYHKVERSEFFDKPEEFDISIDSRFDEIADPALIEKRSHLRWGEHCVQCSPPECHFTCDMYLPRDGAGRCRRFQYGIEKSREHATLEEQSDEIVFLPWSNLLAPVRESAAEYDGFLLRIHNPNRETVPFLFYLKNTSDQIRFMVRKDARPGSNQYFFPLADIARYIPVEEFQGVFIAPDVRDRTRLYFDFHDFVKLRSGFMAEAEISCVAFELEQLFRGEGPLTDLGDDPGIDVKMLTYLRLFAAKDVRVVALSGIDPVGTDQILRARGVHNVLVFDRRSDASRFDTLARMSDHVGVPLKEVAYMGSSAAHREAVAERYPHMTIIKPDSIFLLLFAFYDRRELTEVLEREAKLAAAAEQRALEQASFEGGRAEFIRESGTVVFVETPRPSHLDRLQDIVQLSNRLNFSNRRYARDEVFALLHDEQQNWCGVITAGDRYGDYGIVGLFIVDITQRKQWRIRDLMLSCTVAGRDIDLFVLRYILDQARSRAVSKVELSLSLNTMNENARHALERCGFEHVCTEHQHRCYVFDVSTKDPPPVEHIKLGKAQGAARSTASETSVP